MTALCHHEKDVVVFNDDVHHDESLHARSL
jgi:hypothetical protein